MTMENRRPQRALVPWRIFREPDEWDRRFDAFFNRPVLPWPELQEKAWMPAVDVYEKDDKYVVKAELPGMKEEDIDVSMSGDVLTIKGEKKYEKEVKEENYYRSERSYGSFSRSIPFPTAIDAENIVASYEDGVLEITVPKSATVKPRKVPVSTKKKKA